jgi:hypothetical protein
MEMVFIKIAFLKMVDLNDDVAIECCRTAIQVPAISKRGDAKNSPMRKELVKINISVASHIPH